MNKMTLKLKTTVTAFIFHNNKLLLIKHKRTGKWLHVGGHAEENETLDETLEREIKEEVNLEVKFLEKYNHYEKVPSDNGFKDLPKPFYIHVRNSGDHRKMSFDFVCVAEQIDDLKILESEVDGYQWFTKEEIQNSKELWEPIKILALKAFGVYDKWATTQKGNN